MSGYIDRLERAYASLISQINFRPKVLLALGSGLGNIADGAEIVGSVAFENIEGMPESTVRGHAGRFVFAYVRGVPVAIMQGRLHYYEGHTPQECVMPVRLIGMMGAEIYFVTNASGGITCSQVGSLMRITDHISLVPSPLIGENYDRLGKRFPDMTAPYDEQLAGIMDDVARANGIDLKKGVYIQFQGPALETASEIRMAKILGADIVGMSTAIEVLAARHMGMRVAALSCIVNPACGTAETDLNNIDEDAAIDKSSEDIRTLIFGTIERIKEL